MTPLCKISKAEFDRWCIEGECLESKYGYPSVILHPDGLVTKLWARPHRLLSSSRWRPYSKRFVENAQKLSALGIKVPEIVLHGKLERTHVRIVQYKTLIGTSIRELLESDPKSVDIESLTEYYRHLHDLGILFRSGHFGNIILTPKKDFGLIDFSNLQFSQKPLSLVERGKSLSHPMRYQEDLTLIQNAGLPDFLQTYCNVAKLNDTDSQTLVSLATRS